MKNEKLWAVPASQRMKPDFSITGSNGFEIIMFGKITKLVGTAHIKGFINVKNEFELQEHKLPRVFNIGVLGVGEPCVCFCNNNNNPYILEGLIVLASDIEVVNGIVNISIKDGAV